MCVHECMRNVDTTAYWHTLLNMVNGVCVGGQFVGGREALLLTGAQEFLSTAKVSAGIPTTCKQNYCKHLGRNLLLAQVT